MTDLSSIGRQTVDFETQAYIFDIADMIEDSPEVVGLGYWEMRCLLPPDLAELGYFDQNQPREVTLQVYLRENRSEGGRPVVTDLALAGPQVRGRPFLVEYRLRDGDVQFAGGSSARGHFMASLVVDFLATELAPYPL